LSYLTTTTSHRGDVSSFLNPGCAQVGADGRAYARLFYPGLQEIWPDLYLTSNIQVIQVGPERDGGERRDSSGGHPMPYTIGCNANWALKGGTAHFSDRGLTK